MNLDFTDEQRMIRDVARDFAEREVRPIAAEIEGKAVRGNAILAYDPQTGAGVTVTAGTRQKPVLLTKTTEAVLRTLLGS